MRSSYHNPQSGRCLLRGKLSLIPSVCASQKKPGNQMVVVSQALASSGLTVRESPLGRGSSPTHRRSAKDPQEVRIINTQRTRPRRQEEVNPSAERVAEFKRHRTVRDSVYICRRLAGTTPAFQWSQLKPPGRHGGMGGG